MLELYSIIIFIFKLQALARPAALLERDCDTGIFVQNFINFSDDIF